mmetsp:Transcript_20234/g.47390  ORF Transcript_20234/g.47390 Transcript_20234/m.47390 type:complete len:243 (-) Transcript_20234:2615-3343(-)
MPRRRSWKPIWSIPKRESMRPLPTSSASAPRTTSITGSSIQPFVTSSGGERFPLLPTTPSSRERGDVATTTMPECPPTTKPSYLSSTPSAWPDLCANTSFRATPVAIPTPSSITNAAFRGTTSAKSRETAATDPSATPRDSARWDSPLCTKIHPVFARAAPPRQTARSGPAASTTRRAPRTIAPRDTSAREPRFMPSARSIPPSRTTAASGTGTRLPPGPEIAAWDGWRTATKRIPSPEPAS